MVQVTLTIVVYLRRRAEMIRALRSLMLPLQAAPGFISCRLCREADDANTIFYVEEWHTPEDLNRQIRSTHYSRLLSIMEPDGVDRRIDFPNQQTFRTRRIS